MADTGCSSYVVNLYEFLLPSPIINKKLCMSYDKTELFLQSTIRLIIYIIILKFVEKNNILRNTIYIIIFINLVYLITVTLKTPTIRANNDKSILNLEYSVSK